MFVALAACTPGARAPARVGPPAAAAPEFARVTDEGPHAIDVAPLVATAVAGVARLRGSPVPTPTVEVLSDDAFYEKFHPLLEATFRVKGWTATRHHILNEFVAFASADGRTLWVRSRVFGATWSESQVLARLGAAIAMPQLPVGPAGSRMPANLVAEASQETAGPLAQGPADETSLEKMSAEALRRGFARFYGAGVAKLRFLPPQRALLGITTEDGQAPRGSRDRGNFGDIDVEEIGLNLEEVLLWEEAGFRLASEAYRGGGNGLVDQILRDPPQTFREASGVNAWNYAGGNLEAAESPPGYAFAGVIAPWLQLQLTDSANSALLNAGDIWGSVEVTETKSERRAFVFNVRESNRDEIEKRLRGAGAFVTDGPAPDLVYAAGSKESLAILDRFTKDVFFLPGTYHSKFKRNYFAPERPSTHAFCGGIFEKLSSNRQRITSDCFAPLEVDGQVEEIQFASEPIAASLAHIRRSLAHKAPSEFLDRAVTHLPSGSRALTFRALPASPTDEAEPLFTFLLMPICDGQASILITHNAGVRPLAAATAASDAFLATPPTVPTETVCRLVASERARDLPAPVAPPDLELLH